MKKFVPIEPSADENCLCLTTGFDAGGYNWWNGQETAKGYYLYCTPVLERTEHLGDGRPYKTYTQQLGKGGKLLLKAVTRRSKKAEAEAEKLAEEKQEWIIEQICSKYNLHPLQTKAVTQ